MADNVTLTAIDQTTVANGYVNVTTTVHVGTTDYPQVFTVNATDPVSVASSVEQQAETFRTQVLATSSVVTSPTDLSTLINKVITL